MGCLKVSTFSRHTCNFVPLGAGLFLELGRQRGYPLKRRYFAVIGLYSVKTVADRYRHAAYHNMHASAFLDRLFRFMNIDDLE